VSTWRWTTILAVGVCSSTPAWAETTSESEAVPIEIASAAQKDLAIKQYRQGLELFDAGQFDKALDLFQTSLSKVDSPNSRLMVARCLEKLERYPEAYREFERVLAEATSLARGVKKYESTRDAAKADLDLVKQKVAIVHLAADGQVTMNGEPVPRPEHPHLVLPPGEAVFALQLQNGERVETKVLLKAGDEQTIALQLPVQAPTEAAPAEAAPPKVFVRDEPNGVSRKTLGYIGLGVGGAGALGFVAFGLLDRQHFEELEDKCPAGRCAASSRDVAESGRFYQAAANVSLGVGVVGLVTGTILLLSGESASTEVGEQAASSRVTDVSFGVGEVSVRGQF
jgi:tetratricopeptide (TPR) repeat protein